MLAAGPAHDLAPVVDRLGVANVSAADPSARFVEACRVVPGIEIVEASGEALPFAMGLSMRRSRNSSSTSWTIQRKGWARWHVLRVREELSPHVSGTTQER